MKLHQALKRKNALVNEIKKLQIRIEKHNSILKGNSRPYDIPQLFIELNEKIDTLTALKASLTLANQPVQEKIYRLSELKSLTKFYKALPVDDGKARLREGGYGSEPLAEYESAVKADRVDEMLDAVEKEIQDLQDSLDLYNLTTDL